MAITCWAPDCYHNNMRDSCRFYRFPTDNKVLKTWLSLLRRDAEPGSGARVCSCHFREGNKENLPKMFDHNKDKLFDNHHLGPEIIRRKRSKCPQLSEQSLLTATGSAAD